MLYMNPGHLKHQEKQEIYFYPGNIDLIIYPGKCGYYDLCGFFRF